MSRFKILNTLLLLLGAGFIGAIVTQGVMRAQHKWFWADEAYEILNSCATSYSTLIFKGVPVQCSAAPFHYIVQKFIISHIPVSGENILMFYRGVSLLSCLICLAVLFWFVSRYLTPILGLLVLILMNNQPILHQYAAESRPYLSWMAVFTAGVILFSVLALKPWSQITRLQKVSLGIISYALAAAAGGGIIQLMGFFIFLIVFEYGFNLKNFFKTPQSQFILSVAIVSGLFGANYALRSCHSYDAGPWDLLKTENWGLLLDVTSLLFPFQGSKITLIFNFFFLVGVFAPLFLLKSRKTFNQQKKFALSLTTVTSVQILCAIVIGILVARVHYYFIPRIFIFLIVLRACLVVGGAYFFFDWLNGVLSKRKKLQKVPWSFVFAVIVSLGVLGSAYKSLNNVKEFMATYKRPLIEEVKCPTETEQIAIVYRDTDPLEYGLNFIARLSEELKACRWAPRGGATMVYMPLKPKPDGVFRFEVKKSIPAEESLHPVFFGKSIVP